MSQAGRLRVSTGILPPSVPLQFTADDATIAVPVANNLNLLSTVTVAGVNPVESTALGDTVTYNFQLSQALAAADPTKVGFCNFDSAAFSVDADGFVSLAGGGLAIDEVLLDAGTSPITPDGAGQISILATVVGAQAIPIQTDGTGANTATIEAQVASAIAASDLVHVGFAAFNSSQFSVDANGFVELSGGGLAVDSFAVPAGTSPVVPTAAGLVTYTVGSGIVITGGLNTIDFSLDGGVVGETITGDSGGALSPTLGNWSILGLSGSKTSGSGSTLTIKSPPYADASASATSVLNSGEFVTGAFTRTLPASAGLADGDLFEYICTSASALVIQSVGAQQIRLGSLITSAAGTCTSTAIGDSVTLRFRSADGFFYATSIVGTWVMA